MWDLFWQNDSDVCCAFNAADIADMADSTRYFAAKIREPLMSMGTTSMNRHANFSLSISIFGSVSHEPMFK